MSFFCFQLPSTQQYVQYSHVDWDLESQVDKKGFQCIRNNRLPLSQGKMLGGSSSMNLMWYVRGNPHDYDTWASITGDSSWKYSNVLPYFIKSERLTDEKILNSPYGKYHGTQGPVGVTTIYSDTSTKYLNVFKELGHNVVMDTNANGTLGYSEVMVTAADGIRQSTANTFLSDAKDRTNLHVLRQARASKIIIDDKKVARGVQYIDSNNKTFTVYANKEVIVSAGPLHSPQLLLLSGIGPKNHLQKMGIKVVADLPVGENLLNHHGILLTYKTEKLDPNFTFPPSNPGDFVIPVVTGFVALKKSQKYPDYQASVIITNAEGVGTITCPIIFGLDTDVCQSVYNDIKGREVMFVEISDFTRKPRGRVTLKSKNPLDAPDVHIVAYPDEEAFQTILNYAEDFSKVVNSTYFRSVQGELATLPQCKQYKKNTRAYLDCYSRCMSSTIFHYVSTCRMGSVVDSRLRVYGIKNLRVVDSSIMPTITSGNTNAPTMMIGEKGADMIKKDNKRAGNK